MRRRRMHTPTQRDRETSAEARPQEWERTRPGRECSPVFHMHLRLWAQRTIRRERRCERREARSLIRQRTEEQRRRERAERSERR